MASSGTFSEVSIVPETGVVKVPADLDLQVAALIGCGVLTGARGDAFPPRQEDRPSG